MSARMNFQRYDLSSDSSLLSLDEEEAMDGDQLPSNDSATSGDEDDDDDAQLSDALARKMDRVQLRM